MKKPSDSENTSKKALRDKILGLGEFSLRKSYYPALTKRMEELERYQALLDQTIDAICMLELPSLKLVDLNHSAMELFGLDESKQEQAVLSDILELDSTKKLKEWLKNISEHTQQIRPLMLQTHLPAAPEKTIELTFTHVTFGHNDFAVCVARDITEHKQMLDALRNSEENLRITLNSIGDAVIATDRDGIITRINMIAAQLTGWDREQALNRHLDEVFNIINTDTGEKADSPAAKVIETGQIVGLANHTTLISRDGNKYQISDSGAPILNDENEIVGVVVVFRDVTREYELEEKLRQSQKMESIGKLAGGVAHDFNNMLTGIMSSADLLKRKMKTSSPTEQRLVEIIKESCQRAADLTQKLLSFARKANVVAKPVNVHKSIDTAFNLLERSIDRKIEIIRRFEAEYSMVNGDPTQLANVFLNLGLNARDAMPEGGTIEIITKNNTLSPEECNKTPFEVTPGDYIEVIVSDTGCGIPQDIIEKIFEPFFTTKDVGLGTGLGLSAVYGAVQEHHGAINVKSTPECGTSFHLYFPCFALEQEHVTPPENKELKTSTGCILVIDDEELVRETARAMLEEFGFEVLTAENGQVGVDIYQQHIQEIDAVILDMIMPVMSGKECFEELRKLNQHLKIIIATGYISEQAIRDIKLDNASGFLKKPFTLSELHQELETVLQL